ncbi:membrane protein [Defluviimonas sp. 20V17]|uniref:Membrane protein n=1 Tax=Allgaiera indica TaxID=765699 RepID=A0AAN4URP9_9RHOB|nr:membrane protein [Defluviimonas sp. 20V17]GHE02218.1 membrane protein [Allgaiera indica]SDX06820.1 Uncharacterized protein involved in cysteine biosynthesis [Allgaiera indica]
MILGDFLRALGQIGDPRFRRVLWLGLGLTLLLLIGIYAATLGVIAFFTPDAVTLPWLGWSVPLHMALGLGAGLVMLLASVFLMVPVSGAFSGLFLDQVAAAVEARHYPALPPPPPLPWSEMLVDGLAFFALTAVANLLALGLGLFAGPLAPLLFLAVNGFVLGQGFFQLAAMRRLGRRGAGALRRRHLGQIWLAGVLMALPLWVPIVNLLVPILGAATFTHMFHRLSGLRPARSA